MLLAFNFLLEGMYKEKAYRLWQNPGFLLLPGFYVLHVAGLLYTDYGWQYAWQDLRIKLPLLALPIIIGGSFPIQTKYIHYCGLLLLTATAVSMLWPFVGVFTGYFDVLPVGRSFSRFDSHIRLSLIMVLCLAWLPKLWDNTGKWLHVWLMMSVLIVASALSLMQSFTGFGLILLLGIIYLIGTTQNIHSKILRLFLRTSLLGCILLFLFLVVSEWRYFMVDSNKYLMYANTLNNRPYAHYPELTEKENGNVVWLNINDFESQQEWQKRSSFNFYENGYTGQRIRATLYRYLASRGFTKDSAGVSMLNPVEIEMIERGATNFRFGLQKGLRERVYTAIWEMDKYMTSNENPESNSLAQRFEFWKTAGFVFIENPLMGVGTGDIMAAIQEEYQTSGSKLSPAYRLRPHNQYLTTAATFGLLGLLLFLAIWVYPLIHSKKLTGLHLAFWVIAVTSMIFEDTLETQLGVTFISLFYTLLLLQPLKNEEKA